jgi:hypothetical protein
MNNISYIHPIYVNAEQRAVYDGSLQGFRKAVANLGIEISELHQGAMFGEDTTEEVCDYLFDMHEDACWVLEGDMAGIDSLAVYVDTREPCEPYKVPPVFASEEERAEHLAWRANVTSYEGNPRYAGMEE